MQFEPGVSGNPAGRPVNAKRFAEALDRAIKQDEGKKLRAAAEALLQSAADGDLPSIRELADRLDGKPGQAIEHTGEMIVNFTASDANL
jgi:hypothetical protein